VLKLTVGFVLALALIAGLLGLVVWYCLRDFRG